MKRGAEILILFCLLPGLLAAGASERVSHQAQVNGIALQQGQGVLTDFLKVDTFRLEIIPPSSGVQFFRNGILFLSNTKYEGKMLPRHVSFGTIEAYTAIVKDSSLGLHIPFAASSSFSVPCEATTFSSDYKTMYFTKIARKAKREKIFRAVLKQDAKGESAWVADENPLGFCSGDYIYTHPAISADGNMLIFASDMGGTIGELDLFMVMKDGEKWSRPENLGNQINTKKFECFPFLDKDNNLFYSSDGLEGRGGYDIFTSRFNGSGWDKPVDLGPKINTQNDDIAFCIDRNDGRSAFYTRRPVADKGNMQLFSVTVRKIVVDNNPLSISYIYNGKPAAKAELTADIPKEVPPTARDTVKATAAPVKKESEQKKPLPQPSRKSPEARVVTIKTTSVVPAALKDVVVYRVQFLTTTDPRKENQIIINGVSYKTFEYFYMGAYRYTIGEFTSIGPARELQSLCRKSGFSGAFVAAFKNDTRSLDLSLFK